MNMDNRLLKTLIIYNQIDKELEYLIVDSDLTRFHGCCINSTLCNGHEQEFCDWFYDEKGENKHKMSTDKGLIEHKNWDRVAIVTWLP